MPAANKFRAKSGRRRRYNRRYRRRPTTISLQKQVNTIRKDLRKLPETKIETMPLNLLGIGTAPYTFLLTGVGEGDAENQRTGLEITPRKFDMYLQSTAEAGAENQTRVLVFRWFDDTPPVANDIIYDTTAGIFAGWSTINVPTVWTKKPKFQILDDQRFTMVADTDTEHMYYRYKKHFKKNSKMSFEGSSALSGVSGQLYCMIMSDSAVVPHPSYQGYSRLQFVDA